MGIDISKEFIAASTIPLILAVLCKTDSYGYAIIKRVRALSADTLEWSEGMLYPVLHRLEKQGYISSYWHKESGRRRRYYTILPAGRTELENLKVQWDSINSTLNKSLE